MLNVWNTGIKEIERESPLFFYCCIYLVKIIIVSKHSTTINFLKIVTILKFTIDKALSCDIIFSL